MTVEELIARLSGLPGHYIVESPCPAAPEGCNHRDIIDVLRGDIRVVLLFDERKHDNECTLG